MLSEPVDLATLWPKVRVRLMRTLARRVDRATAEDICQDVAEQALRSGIAFGSETDLLRWSTRVAINRAIGDWRKRRRIVDQEIPDAESPIDLTTIVTDRWALAETEAAMTWLRPWEQAALLAETRPPVAKMDRRASNRESLRRNRGRAQLRRIIVREPFRNAWEFVRHLPALVVLRWGRVSRRWSPWPGELGNVIAGAGITVAALVTPGLAAVQLDSSPTVLAVPATAITTAARSPVSSPSPAAAPTGRPEADRPTAVVYAAAPSESAPQRTTALEVDPGPATLRAGTAENRDPEDSGLCIGTELTGPACIANPRVSHPLPGP